MSWTAKATGDMTLSVLDDNDVQVLKVDMLRENTLKAGTDGDILCRTMNDLQVVANFSDGLYEINEDTLSFPELGISALPWSVQYDNEKRRLTVKSKRKRIAEKVYSKSVSEAYICGIIEILQRGIEIINEEDRKHVNQG